MKTLIIVWGIVNIGYMLYYAYKNIGSYKQLIEVLGKIENMEKENSV